MVSREIRGDGGEDLEAGKEADEGVVAGRGGAGAAADEVEEDTGVAGLLSLRREGRRVLRAYILGNPFLVELGSGRASAAASYLP